MEQGREEVIKRMCQPEFREVLETADVIIGVDEATGNKFVVWGRSTLSSVVASGVSLSGNLVEVPVLQATDELECLLAAVRLAKGRDEYEASTPYGPMN